MLVGKMGWLAGNIQFILNNDQTAVYGKPCLASNTSSMPKVGGNLVDYFSPYDARECLDQIVLEHKAKAIQESYRPRSWYDTFQDVEAFVSQT